MRPEAERQVMFLCPGDKKWKQLFSHVDMMVRIDVRGCVTKQIATQPILPVEFFFDSRHIE